MAYQDRLCMQRQKMANVAHGNLGDYDELLHETDDAPLLDAD